MSTHWASKVELGSAWGLNLLLWVNRWLGRWPFRLFLIPVVSYYFLTQRTKRSASRQYLERLSNQLGHIRKVSTCLVFRHFLSFGEVILDKILAWDPQQVPIRVTRHGHKKLTDLLGKGRGAILIASHLGNMEVARYLAMSEHKVRVNVLVHTKHNPQFMSLMSRMNSLSQMSLIQVSEISPTTAMLLKDKIDAGEIVLIAGDRVPLNGKGIVWADFLGHSAPFPFGPYVLASVLECPVFLFFCIGRNGTYDIHFELFSDRIELPRNSRREDLTSLASRYAERLAHYCACAPLLWGNFYFFWENSEVVNP